MGVLRSAIKHLPGNISRISLKIFPPHGCLSQTLKDTIQEVKVPITA